MFLVIQQSVCVFGDKTAFLYLCVMQQSVCVWVIQQNVRVFGDTTVCVCVCVLLVIQQNVCFGVITHIVYVFCDTTECVCFWVIQQSIGCCATPVQTRPSTVRSATGKVSAPLVFVTGFTRLSLRSQVFIYFRRGCGFMHSISNSNACCSVFLRVVCVNVCVCV